MPALGVIARSTVALLATQTTLAPEATSTVADSSTRGADSWTGPWGQGPNSFSYGVDNIPVPSDWKGSSKDGWNSIADSWKGSSSEEWKSIAGNWNDDSSNDWKGSSQSWKDGSGNWKDWSNSKSWKGGSGNWQDWSNGKSWKGAPKEWKDKWANGTWSPNDWKDWNGKWNGTWPGGWYPGAGGKKYYPDKNKWFYFGGNGQKYYTGGKWDSGKWVPVEKDVEEEAKKN
jgi:hypothetical protein